jgi:CheY-like chemotaxis protein
LAELVETRQTLIENIKEAEKLYDTESEELCLVKNGLKHIDEMIAALRESLPPVTAHILAVLNRNETANQISASLHLSCQSVILAATFFKAMDILRSDKIDLIIADIRVQDDESEYSSVFDFMRWVKGDPLLRSIPFVCLSLEPILDQTLFDGVRIAARSLGAARYLTMEKFDPALFRAEIELLLPGSRRSNPMDTFRDVNEQ